MKFQTHGEASDGADDRHTDACAHTCVYTCIVCFVLLVHGGIHILESFVNCFFTGLSLLRLRLLLFRTSIKSKGVIRASTSFGPVFQESLAALRA